MIRGALFDLSGSYTLPFAVGGAAGLINLAIIGSLYFFHTRGRKSRMATVG